MSHAEARPSRGIFATFVLFVARTTDQHKRAALTLAPFGIKASVSEASPCPSVVNKNVNVSNHQCVERNILHTFSVVTELK